MIEVKCVRTSGCRLLGVLPRGRGWDRTVEVVVVEGEYRADGAVVTLRLPREEALRLLTELKRVFR